MSGAGAAGQIAERGYQLDRVELPAHVRTQVAARDWPALDRAMRAETLPGGAVFERLREYAEFSEIEFIISIRSSLVEPDENGIWHDDGSRLLAFSLSVTLDHTAVEGGRLQVRRRETEAASEEIPTPPFGTLIVFATGQQGFEHRIQRVTAGERIIIAGWCT